MEALALSLGRGADKTSCERALLAGASNRAYREPTPAEQKSRVVLALHGTVIQLD